MSGETTGADVPASHAPAFVWPYVLFAPLPWTIGLSGLGVMMASALRDGSPPAALFTGVFAAYVTLAPPSLLLALLHRSQFRKHGGHRLLPVLGLALFFGFVGFLILLVAFNSHSMVSSRDLGLLALMSTAGALALALTGYGAVRLMQALRSRQTPAASAETAAT